MVDDTPQDQRSRTSPHVGRAANGQCTPGSTPPRPEALQAVLAHDTMRQGAFEEIPNGKKRAFLAAYAAVGTLTGAAKLARCDISSHYVWKKRDPAYVAAFTRAQALAAETLEDEATRRAMGWEETHYTAAGTPYTVYKYSDTLLIFRLKALKPEVYRDHHAPDSGQKISDLLQAVLLELSQGRPGNGTAHDPTPSRPGRGPHAGAAPRPW